MNRALVWLFLGFLAAIPFAAFAQDAAPPAISESTNACGAGAAARGVSMLIQDNGLTPPPNWKTPQDIYEFMLTAMKTVAKSGTNTDNFLKAKEMASRELGKANPGWRIETTSRPLQDQKKRDKLNAQANASAAFSAIAAALKDKTKVVEAVTADWNGSVRDGGHCFLVTGIESKTVGPPGQQQTIYRLTGVDDINQQDGQPGADPITSDWYDANGLEIDPDDPEPVDPETFQGGLVSIIFFEEVTNEEDEFGGFDGLVEDRVDDASNLKKSKMTTTSGKRWSLVSRVPGCNGSAMEVWRDDTTGKLWSDAMHGQTCEEGLALAASPHSFDCRGWIHGKKWRVPTKAEWQEAESHGLREVLPGLVNTLFWIASEGRDAQPAGRAEVYFGNSGRFGERKADSAFSVRWIGE